jgi:hypothetical protein
MKHLIAVSAIFMFLASQTVVSGGGRQQIQLRQFKGIMAGSQFDVFAKKLHSWQMKARDLLVKSNSKGWKSSQASYLSSLRDQIQTHEKYFAWDAREPNAIAQTPYSLSRILVLEARTDSCAALLEDISDLNQIGSVRTGLTAQMESSLMNHSIEGMSLAGELRVHLYALAKWHEAVSGSPKY